MVDRAHPRRDGTQAHSTDAPSREGDSTWSRWQVFRLWAAAPGLPTRSCGQWLSGGAANSPNTAARPRRLPSPRINDLAIINPRLGPLFPFQPRRSRISPRVQGTFNSAPAYDRSQARLAPLARECQAESNHRTRPTQRAQQHPASPVILRKCSCIQVLPDAAAAARYGPRRLIMAARFFSRRPFQARPTPSRRASCKADLTHHQQGSPTRHSSHRRTRSLTHAASLVLSCSIVPATPSRVTRNKSRLIGYGSRR